MPGIDVRSDGRIQYQGQDINKFYIEGSDLLGGKYGVATNGISYDDVGAVDIMENHQPMQVLSGISFSEQAGINLRLKTSRKVRGLPMGMLAEAIPISRRVVCGMLMHFDDGEKQVSGNHDFQEQ